VPSHTGIPTPFGTYWHQDGTAEEAKDVTVELGVASVAVGLALAPPHTGIPTLPGTYWHHDGTPETTNEFTMELGPASVDPRLAPVR